MLMLDNISIHYKSNKRTFSLKNIHITIEKGTIYSLLGRSGSGKSTLLKIIAGLITTYQGTVSLNGVNINNVKCEKRNIGMVFQEPLLFPSMNVAENVGLGLKLRKIPRVEVAKAVDEALEYVEMQGYGKTHPSELSGGERQRISLARTLIMNPELILMDEPLSNLDNTLRKTMQELIKRIQSHFHTTILFVTHDYNEALYLSDTIGIMRDGLIIEEGTPHSLTTAPLHLYTAHILGEKNIIPGKSALSISGNLDNQSNVHSAVLKQNSISLIPDSRFTSVLGKGSCSDLFYKEGILYCEISINEHKLYIHNPVNDQIHIQKGEIVTLYYDPEKIVYVT